MQVVNTGSQARFIMNVNTCLGCFVGVTIVLFLWGFAKEVSWVIIPLLIFAGSVMVKLAFEGIEYFEEKEEIPVRIRQAVVKVLQFLHFFTTIFTFWIPELGSPKVKKMTAWQLAKWAFLLPFIIGLDDLVGYMGAMTIYNVFSLLFGIYLADIVIDILIFVSPSFTKKLVENATLSLLAAVAFLYLAYKSYSEATILLHEHYHLSPVQLVGVSVFILMLGGAFGYSRWKKHRD
jgi:putative Ca2+/H+ antiporter (TMEM165/GDT1 family)